MAHLTGPTDTTQLKDGTQIPIMAFHATDADTLAQAQAAGFTHFVLATPDDLVPTSAQTTVTILGKAVSSSATITPTLTIPVPTAPNTPASPAVPVVWRRLDLLHQDAAGRAEDRDAGQVTVVTDLFFNGQLNQLKPLRKMAARFQKLPEQLALRWALEHGLLPVVDSQWLTPAQATAIFDFELSFQDMQVLDALDGRIFKPSRYQIPAAERAATHRQENEAKHHD
ncbi:hypothetical protein [Lacticaseibacillus mingshuiensis]|uniref:NADP-dependent oxidoreductase domain-containing protein n=1 Tax=Lacticaseibacillus mingshuiensis TaxID=2799574 RepID=A0ABW4CH20_9LACO|nr:hypothetical protein [Lacticaseibacillus mingshuiensis]